MGFCQALDFSTFAPLETQSFGPSSEQAFLTAYRAFGKSALFEDAQLESLEPSREADKGRPLDEQLHIQEFICLHAVGIRSAISDLTHHKTLFDADLIARDSNHVRYVAIHLDRIPEMVCSGLTQLDHTFDGTLIQDIADTESVLHMIAFSLVVTEAGGAASFAWRDSSDAACSLLVDSLLSLSEATSRPP